MTLRAKPVSRRPGRSGWDNDDRRTRMINGAFVGAIVLSVLLLIGSERERELGPNAGRQRQCSQDSDTQAYPSHGNPSFQNH